MHSKIITLICSHCGVMKSVWLDAGIPDLLKMLVPSSFPQMVIGSRLAGTLTTETMITDHRLMHHIGSSPVLDKLLKQEDRSYVHASIELHLHVVHVFQCELDNLNQHSVVGKLFCTNFNISNDLLPSAGRVFKTWNEYCQQFKGKVVKNRTNTDTGNGTAHNEPLFACEDTTHNLSPEVFFEYEPQQLRNEPENAPLITFSPKSDPLHHEFTGELITIPPGIVREHEDYINRMPLLCSNSSSQLPENFHTIIESLPISTTRIEEEIDIFSGPDDSIPPGIESDFDSEEDIIDNLLNNDSAYERLTFNIDKQC
ncbi:hypothetical protein Tco_0994194 [Tanacetum coccineum]